MHGLSIIIPTMIIFCLSNMTEEIFDMNRTARNYQLILLFVLQTLLLFLFSTDYLTHLVQRQIFFWFCNITIHVTRKRIGDISMDSSVIIAIWLLYIIILELILYVNHRAKAKLFLQMKMISM